MSAGWTTAWSRRPNVSTRMCRFLPLIFLPASYPCGSMNAPLFPRFSRNGAPRQKPKHNHPTTDPLVNPGNPPHCYQTCSKADSTRTYHRVVFLAQSSPGCRSTRPLQIKKATVMLATKGFLFASRQNLWRPTWDTADIGRKTQVASDGLTKSALIIPQTFRVEMALLCVGYGCWSGGLSAIDHSIGRGPSDRSYGWER